MELESFEGQWAPHVICICALAFGRYLSVRSYEHSGSVVLGIDEVFDATLITCCLGFMPAWFNSTPLLGDPVAIRFHIRSKVLELFAIRALIAACDSRPLYAGDLLASWLWAALYQAVFG